MDVKGHWEGVHENARPEDKSWYQDDPRMSLKLLDSAGVGPGARVLEVGCGGAGLPAHLLARGYVDVVALDVSAHAIKKAQTHLGNKADAVEWVQADVRDFHAARPFDVWHDRAVFHFLVDPADQKRYAHALMRNLAPGGVAIIGTFAPDGPESCSGLPVARHDAGSLVNVLGEGLDLVQAAHEEHETPWGTKQPFTWVLLRRR